jgi:hypothetical protein
MAISEYVYWQTEITMPEPPPASEGHETETHCSAFAAAAALKLGVPLLHPNPFPQVCRGETSRQSSGGSLMQNGMT